MDHQDWKPVILTKKNPIKTTNHPQVPNETKNLDSDTALPPAMIETDKRKRIVNLRTFLKMNQKEFAKKCCIPLNDYKALENGTLLKNKASVLISKIFNSHTKIIQENGL